MEESILILKGYFEDGIKEIYSLYALLIICAIWLLGTIFIGILTRNTQLSTRMKVQSALFLSGVTTLLFTLITSICIVKFSDFLVRHRCQLGILLGVLIISAITIYKYIHICTEIKNKKKTIIGLSLISKDSISFIEKSKKRATLLWLTTLFFVLPFFLLLIPKNSTQLLSVIVDNSGSTEEYLEYETVLFASILKKTNVKCDYILTYFNEGNYIPYENIESITNELYPNKLHASTEILSTQDDFLNSLKSIQSENVYGSPIYEAIWQNFLSAKGMDGDYDSKRMIIITDGYDNLYQLLGKESLEKNIFKYTQGKDSVSMLDWYGDSQIFGINYVEEYGDLFMYRDCVESILILDGSDESSYYNSLLEIIPDFFFDYVLLYTLAIIMCLISIICLISKKIIL